jgi:hypothetical protein
MTYKNKDPGAEKDAIQIANQTVAYFEKEIARVIQKTYSGRHWAVISLELRHAALDEIKNIFSDKMLELKQTRRDNEWRYKAQDETYPELKEDLKEWI